MDKRTNKGIEAFIALVTTQYSEFIKAVLFGSYAQGNHQINSDIDVALVFSHLDDMDKFDLQVQLMLQASEFDLRIEPHPMSEDCFYSNNPFAVEIRRTGVEINPKVAKPM
jgi:predicted nucleotidyltransferase